MKEQTGLVLIVAAVAIAGCGGASDRLPVIPTRGLVIVDGKPAVGALLIFHPVEGTPKLPVKARARVHPDGTFVAESYDAGDGVPAGEYIVTVDWREPTEQEGDEGALLLPEAYTSPESSPVKVRVSSGPDGKCELAPIRIVS